MIKVRDIFKKVFLYFGLSLLLLGLFAPYGVKAATTTGFLYKDPLPNGAYKCRGYALSDSSPTGMYRCVINGIDARATRTWISLAGPYVSLKTYAYSPAWDFWSPSVWINW